MATEGVLLTLVLSLAVAVAYGLVLGGREDRIREYFRTQARGRLRQSYIQAMVGAVRGEAVVLDSLVLVSSILAFGVLLSAWLQYNAGARSDELVGLDQKISELSEESSGASSQPFDKEAAMKDLRKQLDAVIATENQLRPKVVLLIRAERWLGDALYASCALAWLLWRPYVRVRAVFGHEIARFSLRIQGLASKNELTRLTMAELKVRDQATLKEYVGIMQEVAARHGVPDLTKTFELWQDKQ